MKISNLRVLEMRHARSPNAIPYRLTADSARRLADALSLDADDLAKIASAVLCIDVPKGGEHNVLLKTVSCFQSAPSFRGPGNYEFMLRMEVFGVKTAIAFEMLDADRNSRPVGNQHVESVLEIDCYTDEERVANIEAQRLAAEEADNALDGVQHCQMGATSSAIGLRAVRGLIADAKREEKILLVLPTYLEGAVDSRDNLQVVFYDESTCEWPKSEIRGRTNNMAILIRAHKVDPTCEARLESLRLAMGYTLLTEGGDAFVIYF